MDILLPRYKSVGISDNKSFYVDKLVRALNHIILPNVIIVTLGNVWNITS